MKVRTLLREPRCFVPAGLLHFLDLDQLPASVPVPAHIDGKRWQGVLKSDAADFLVCEPVREYPGISDELLEEVRAKRRYLTVGPDSDMPGLRTDERLWVYWKDQRVPAVALTMVKCCENTWNIGDRIADMLTRSLGRHIHHSRVLTSGLKDKRAWTAQTVVVVGVTMEEMLSVRWPTWAEFTAERRGFFVKDLRPTSRLISMGDHEWNGFQIKVLVEGKTKEELDEYVGLYAKVLKLKGEHIPDGFHRQRLGPGQDMQIHGDTLLTGNYVPSPEREALQALTMSLTDLSQVSIVSGDFSALPTDALVVPVSKRGECQSRQVEGVLKRVAPSAYNTVLAARRPWTLGETLVVRTDEKDAGFANVLFAAEGARLADWVANALESCERAGFTTAVLPAVQMHDNNDALAQISEGVRRFYEQGDRNLQLQVAAFYECHPFGSNVEAMLHCFACEPSQRDNDEVRLTKEVVRRHWMDNFARAVSEVNRVARRSGVNLSLESEVVKRYADMEHYNGCAEAILYDLRDRLSLGFGAVQGFFANQEIARQIQHNLSTPGDRKRVALPMSCAESRDLYGQSEVGQACLRMLGVTEDLAATAEPYMAQFIAAYWEPIEEERQRLRETIKPLDVLWQQMYRILGTEQRGRLEAQRKELKTSRRPLNVQPTGPNGRLETVTTLLMLEKQIDDIEEQLRQLDAPDRDTGLSFVLTRTLFDLFAKRPPGVELKRPSHAALSAAFVKYLYLTPRDRKNGSARTRPPKRNVYAKVEGFYFTCENGAVTFWFALPRGSYATMLISLLFDTTDKREVSLDEADSSDSDL